jgi:HEAT repeat protein
MMRLFLRTLLPLFALIALTAALAQGADGLSGKMLRDKVNQLNAMILNKPANLDAVLATAFFAEQEPELIVIAGKALLPKLKGAELQKAIKRITEFTGPLPALNLSPDLIRQCAPDELGQQVVAIATRQNWWEQRNACIIAGFTQDVRYVPLMQQLLAAPSRVVRLEAIVALSRINKPEAAKALQAFFPLCKPEERISVLRALAGCGAESDVPWIMQQLSANAIDSVIGAWTVTRLSKALPKEALALLKNTNAYPRRAGLLLLQRFGTKEQWLELLKTAKAISYPDVLEAIGNHFFKEPAAEAGKLLLDCETNLAHKDFRVPDAWARALGACAAAGDDKNTKEHALKVLSTRLAEIMGPKLNDARKKERRELCISAIYGLAALGTQAAREVLTRVAFDASDEIVAMYAAFDVMRDPDASAIEKYRNQCASLRDKGPQLFQRATLLLGCNSDRSNVETLIDFLAKAPDDPSRLLVRDALGQITGHDFGNDPIPWQNWWKATTNFVFLEDKFKAIKKDGAKITKPHGDGEYDVRSLDIMELRKDITAGVTRFKGDDDTEAAVASALRWLADHQDPDGKWNGSYFTDLTIGRKNDQVAQKFGRQNVDISLTGLSLLAFMAANHTQLSEKSIYRETVSRALEWTVAHQLDDGSYEEVTDVAKGGANYFNYEQGIMTLALSEAYGMTKAEDLKLLAQRGLDKIFSGQSPGDGWRYVPRLYSDTSVVGWMINAIKSGLMSGLEVDPRYRPSTLDFFQTVMAKPKFTEDPKDVSDDYDKSVGLDYKDEDATGRYMKEDPRLTTSGTAIVGANLIFMGYARSYPFCIGAANHLKKNLPQLQWHKAAAKAKYAVPIYYYYYATLFMHQMGGDDWNTWNAAIKTSLVSAQVKPPENNAGAFPAIGFDGDVGGEIYSTAMCTLTLETYYRYLPMLWFR